ncbi:MAG: sigma-70 family RNA polymerase sigma factor, partial [Planctomycetota bacterium]
RDRAAADDLFQETFLTAWRTFDRFDRSRPLGPWLRGIARHKLREARRAEGRRVRHLSAAIDERLGRDLDRLAAAARRSDDPKRKRLTAVAACVEQLSERGRALIRQTYAEGRNAAELAAALGSSHAAVRKRLQRLRERIAACVAERLGADSPVSSPLGPEPAR